MCVSIGVLSTLLVIGANGVGKSTLIKLMMGMLEATGGHIDRNRQARITYFTQHHYDQLDLTTSAVEYFLKRFQKDLEETPDRTQFVRRHLGRFGIKGDRQNQKMRVLSGGQKSRVAFAAMTFKTPHFIIMDEVCFSFVCVFSVKSPQCHVKSVHFESVAEPKNRIFQGISADFLNSQSFSLWPL